MTVYTNISRCRNNYLKYFGASLILSEVLALISLKYDEYFLGTDSRSRNFFLKKTWFICFYNYTWILLDFFLLEADTGYSNRCVFTFFEFMPEYIGIQFTPYTFRGIHYYELLQWIKILNKEGLFKKSYKNHIMKTYFLLNNSL